MIQTMEEGWCRPTYLSLHPPASTSTPYPHGFEAAVAVDSSSRSAAMTQSKPTSATMRMARSCCMTRSLGRVTPCDAVSPSPRVEVIVKTHLRLWQHRPNIPIRRRQLLCTHAMQAA